MGPFNYPLNETFTTLIPALIMGNTVIFKPPKYGVLLHAPLLEAFAESFPPGVVNTVYGDGPKVVGPLMESGAIDVLAFIGSARVASILKHQHPQPNRLRCVFGLEAKNPGIILPHADLETTVRECVARRALVQRPALHRDQDHLRASQHRRRVRRAVQRIASAADRRHALGEGVQITPLPEEGKPDWLAGARRRRRRPAGRRSSTPAAGTSITRCSTPPCSIPVRPTWRSARSSSSAPSCRSFPTTTRQVLDWVVDSPVGQQAALFGTDAAALSRLIDPLVNQVCRVNINSQCQRGPDTFPFTGRKDSAEGTLSVTDALRVFSIRSLVSAKTTEANTAILSDIVTNRRSKFLSTDFLL
jgi:glyceraldehyde-3-phosphate dehydrogenase (NADP+)